jgi:cytochrome c oxidase cbb3-type subunit 2/cytochrome c oxidase cbb3-type subunit I/II
MKMTPALVIFGSMVLFWVSFVMVVLVPMYTMPDQPSTIWRPLTPTEEQGRKLFVANGCTYCHSQYVRPQDWDLGAERIAQPGDYFHQFPHLLGSERTGPDLSQEGGEHPDDWHLAHFTNPRFTRPMSLMPQFSFYDRPHLDELTAYVQSLGGHDADYRVARQRYWKGEVMKAHMAGGDAHITFLHNHVPEAWRAMPNEYEPTPAALARGLRTYQLFCIGCHGPVGDGQGPAAKFLDPAPLNFTTLKRNLWQGKYIGGILYYQIMNGVTGTDMPYFKKELESAKIWDVSNFIEVNFIGVSDWGLDKDKIGVANEGPPPPAAGGGSR